MNSKFVKLIIIVLGIISLFGIPIFTSVIMNMKPLFGMSISTENDWIGFYASYFGAILGGIFTYIGIRITIFNQEKERIKYLNIENRPLINMQEITGTTTNLKDVVRDGKFIKVIATEQYHKAKEIEKNVEEGKDTPKGFNFLEIENIGKNIAVNCSIVIGLTFSEENEDYTHEMIIIPTINLNEKFYILIDPVPISKKYYFSYIKMEYETVTSEKFKIERIFSRNSDSVEIADVYYIKNDKDEYEELYRLNGSSNQWVFVQ